MVTLRGIEPSAHGYLRRGSPFDLRAGSADDTPPLAVVAAGMRSVVEALNSGALSEDRAVELITYCLRPMRVSLSACRLAITWRVDSRVS
jgi:hypothetical protein